MQRISWWSAMQIAYRKFRVELIAYILVALLSLSFFGVFLGAAAFLVLAFIVKASFIVVVYASSICECGEVIASSDIHCSRCGTKTPRGVRLDKDSDE